MSAVSPYSNLLPPFWKETIINYLKEDVPNFDIGGFVVGNSEEEAAILCKQSGVLAGVPFANLVFEQLGIEVRWLRREGDYISSPEKVAVLSGPCRNLLLAERTVLNMITRASGIATAARKLSNMAKEAKWHGEIAGTRKLTPGFRLIEKYALLVGGVSTHRMDLSHMIMLKDNHIWATGSITNAVKAARSVGGFSSKIEVEARSLHEAIEAAEAGAEVVMLDNYPSPSALDADAALLKQSYPHVLVEASGGITASTIKGYFTPHIDIVSMGALTQGYSCIDFSMKIVKGKGADLVNEVCGSP